MHRPKASCVGSPVVLLWSSRVYWSRKSACVSRASGFPGGFSLVMYPILVLTAIAVLGCSDLYRGTGRWELGFSGGALEDGRYELRVGDEVVSVSVSKGDNGRIIRDRFAGTLRDSGYDVSCQWDEPTWVSTRKDGTTVPIGGEHFLLVGLPGRPEGTTSPLGIDGGMGGPRPSRQQEMINARRMATQWIEHLSDSTDDSWIMTLDSIEIDDELSTVLNGLRREGKFIEPRAEGEVTVNCNQAVVQYKDGSIGTVVLERDSTKLWTVTEIDM